MNNKKTEFESIIIKPKGVTFENNEWRCNKCGSTDVTIRCGMMVDRAICNNCGNEDYI